MRRSGISVEWYSLAKLSPPQQRAHLLKRERLFSDIDLPKVVLVNAPAGYGKTTFLTQLHRRLTESGVHVAWLSLDEDVGRDPALFACYVVLAIKQAGLDWQLLPDRQDMRCDGIDGRDLLKALLNRLDALTRKLVIFLDDLHHLRSPEHMGLVDFMVQNLPHQVQLVISSRAVAKVQMSKLRAQNNVKELTPVHLRFTVEEAGIFFESAGSPSNISALLQKTEGWPAALQLFRHALQEGRSWQDLMNSDFAAASVEFAEFLAEQILQEWPEDLAMILMKSALPGRINGDLLNALAGRQDGWELLERFASQHLLIFSLEGQGQWYRYHKLLSDFLRQRLRRKIGAEVADLHTRAAQWFRENGSIREALHHALQAGQHQVAAEVIESLGVWRLTALGGISVVKMANDLPEEIASAFPRVRCCQIYIDAHDGQYDKAAKGIEVLRESTRDFWFGSNGQKDLELFIECGLLECLSEFISGTRLPLKRLYFLEKAAEGLSACDMTLGGMIRYFKLVAHYQSGNISLCLKISDEVNEYFSDRTSPFIEAYSKIYVGLGHAEGGELGRAAASYTEARSLSISLFGRLSSQAIVSDALLARIHYERGEIDTAAELISSSLADIEGRYGWFDLFVEYYHAITFTALQRDGVDHTLALLEKCELKTKKRGIRGLDKTLGLFRIFALVWGGRVDAANELAEELELSQISMSSGGGTAYPFPLAALAKIALARIAIRRDDPDRAEDILTPMDTEAEAKGQTGTLARVLLLRTLIKLRVGDRKAAIEFIGRLATIATTRGLRSFWLEEGELSVDLIRFARDTSAASGPESKIYEHLLTLATRLFTTKTDQGGSANRRAAERSASKLSRQESKIVVMLAEGMTSKEIASRLSLSINTVQAHRKGIYKKLNVHTRSKAIAVARTLDLI